MFENYKIITKKKELDKLIAYCKQTGYASVDFETNALPITHDLFYPTILGVSFQPNFGYIIPLGHFDSPFINNWEKLLKKFSKEVIENPGIIKICQNLKFEYKIFKRYNIEMKGRLFDTMLAKYLLDEHRPHGLKPMVAKFLPKYAGYEENYEGSKLPWDRKPLIGLSQYCALDCSTTFQLMLHFEKRLLKSKLYSLFRNMMMMGTRVLGDSEFEGMPIDEPYLEDLIVMYDLKIKDIDIRMRNNRKIKKVSKQLIESKVQKLTDKVEKEIKDLKKEIKQLKKDAKKESDPKENRKIHTAINRKLKSIESREDKIDRYITHNMITKSEQKVLEPINFNSPGQMIELLFESELGFNFDIVKYTVNKDTKQETENPSTDEEVLLELAKQDKSGFIDLLLEYRGVTKLYSTYIIGIHEKIVNGKIHGRFNLHGTVTGRLSSNDPNLQNIPRDTTSSHIKPMFIPPPGYLLLQLDYSQAELRVMAAMAGEDNMIKWFNEGKDIHLTVALKKERCEERYDEIKELLDKEDDSDEFIFWKKKRKAAKTINFGIIYGQGPPKLAAELGWKVEEAKKFLREYFALFPRIRDFINKQHNKAHEYGYVKSVFGRKRRLIDIDSFEKYKVAEAERQSVNSPIQGAASDYTLFSSILIWEQVRKGYIKLDKPQCYTVHDSLGFFVRPEHIHDVVPKLEHICNNPETKEWFGFEIKDVKMKVDFEVSHENWGKLKTYNPEIDYVSLTK